MRGESGGASEGQRRGKGPGRWGRRHQLLIASESIGAVSSEHSQLPLCGVRFS